MQGSVHHSGWFVCHTKPRQEAVAQAHLQGQGYEVYLPELTRWVRHARGWQRSCSALFPRYAFVRPGLPGQSIAPVRSTPGVTTLVRFGYQLATMPAERLERLRELMTHAQAAGPETPLAEGMNVFFASGPLKGLSGIVSSVADERVTVLFSLLGQPQRVAVPLQQLAIA